MNVELKVRNITKKLKDCSMPEKNTTQHGSCENTQNSLPIVLLERLNFSAVDCDENLSMNSQESVFENSVSPVSNYPNSPMQITEVYSISKKKNNKVQKYNNLSKNCFNDKVLDSPALTSSYQFLKHKTMKCNINIRKPKSLQMSSFNVPEISSVDNIYSDDSSNENIPLMSLSKQKSLNVHSFHHSDDSSDDEIPLVNLSKTYANRAIGVKTKNRNIKSKAQNVSAEVKYPQTSRKVVNKSAKCKKSANSSQSLVKKKKSKKSLRKKQKKLYKMMMKYLKKQIKSRKHKKKAKKKEHLQEPKNLKSRMLDSSNNKSDPESGNNIEVICDSVEQQNISAEGDSFQKDELSSQNISHCESTSTSKEDEKAKQKKKIVENYRLGFLTKKHSLRFHNKLLASARLLLSKSKMKKNKKKELKRFFNKMKAVGLLNYKV